MPVPTRATLSFLDFPKLKADDGKAAAAVSIPTECRKRRLDIVMV